MRKSSLLHTLLCSSDTLQFLALLSSNDPSTLLSDQCTTFLRTHWNAGQEGAQLCTAASKPDGSTRNCRRERQEPVCKTLRFSALKGGIPGSSHITQLSFVSSWRVFWMTQILSHHQASLLAKLSPHLGFCYWQSGGSRRHLRHCPEYVLTNFTWKAHLK